MNTSDCGTRAEAVEVTLGDELPEGTIKATIASGLTQRELADRLHLEAQQIQRHQKERYASARVK